MTMTSTQLDVVIQAARHGAAEAAKNPSNTPEAMAELYQAICAANITLLSLRASEAKAVDVKP
jgi:hypothetical protein